MRLDLESEEEAGFPAPRKQNTREYFSLEKTYTPIQLMLAEHEKFFSWTNSNVMKDRTAYYALAHKVLKEKGESSLKGILDWCKAKRVHIRAVIKILAKPK